jgi:hypothetical protein
MSPRQADDMDEHHKTITVERPTGPRIAPEQPVSVGELVVSKGKSVAKSVGTVAALSLAVLAKYKWAIGGSAVLAVSTHLIVASMMMGIIADKKPTISTSFTGPGDVVASGTSFWFGLRAFSAAKRGTKAINLCNVADAACADVLTDGTTGDLLAPTNIGGIDCTAITVCTIKIFYDQTGNTDCAGPAACDALQATIASRATFTWNCQNGHPCAKKAGGAGVLPAVGPTYTQSLPYTVVGVGNRTGATTTQTALMKTNGLYFLWTSSANTFGIFGGAFLTITGTGANQPSDGTAHSMLGIYTAAGTSCTFEVDGIAAPVTNTCGTTTDGTLHLMTDDSNAMTGNYMESGAWRATFSPSGGGQQDLMLANMKAYWGTP